MALLSPQPRFRMYTRYSYYSTALWRLINGSYAEGDNKRRLEKELATRLRVKHSICMPQGRVGIYLAVSAVTTPGAEIILSPNTIADVINMVICTGAKPVFCDIDPATGNLDPTLVEFLITEKTKAILVTHLYGLMAPMDTFKDIAKKHNLFLIEDAAQAFGAQIDEKKAGTIGDIGVYSFGYAKNITSFLGGMLVTNNDEIEKSIRQKLSSFKIVSNTKLGKKIFSCFIKDAFSSDLFFPQLLFRIFRFGYNNNIRMITRHIETELDLSLKQNLPESYMEQMSDLQAHFVLSKLDNVEEDYHHRLECVRIYDQGLRDIEELRLPPFRTDGSHVYNYYTMGYEKREELRLFMMQHNRDVALQHIKNTADLPAFKEYHQDCPHCRKWANETLMMPNYAKYRLKEVERNVAVIRKFFRK